MCTAMCATIVTKRLKKRYVEEIFLLGLLHSLGQIVLLVHQGTTRDYPKVMQLIRDTHVDYASAEQNVFGFAHPLIGALVAKKWNFSADTCQVILHYKDPLEGSRPDSETEEKSAIVHLGDLVAHAAGIGSPEGYPNQLEQITALATFLGFDPKNLDTTVEEIINETQRQFEGERHVYE